QTSPCVIGKCLRTSWTSMIAPPAAVIGLALHGSAGPKSFGELPDHRLHRRLLVVSDKPAQRRGRLPGAQTVPDAHPHLRREQASDLVVLLGRHGFELGIDSAVCLAD